MRILLDTQMLLWAAGGILPKRAAAYIEDTEHTLMFSPVSIWEIVIKNSLGRRDFSVDPAALYRGLIEAGYQETAVTANHALLIASLPMLHKDPFDRLLLAQAAYEGLTILTSDATLAAYNESIILVE